MGVNVALGLPELSQKTATCRGEEARPGAAWHGGRMRRGQMGGGSASRD